MVADINGDVPLNPASNTKLLTLAAVLSELGPEWRFTTRLCGLADDVTIDRLALWSNGDPTLDRSAMLDLGFQLVQRGIKRVRHILVDQSAFDENFVPPAFEQRPHEWAAFRAPVSAVAFEGNTVSIFVFPTGPGQAAKVAAFPPSFVDLVSTARTAHAGEKSTPVVVIPSVEHTGLRVSVNGAISRNSAPVTLNRRVEDPRLLPGFALADVLRLLGVHVTNSIELGACDPNFLLAVRTSSELTTIIRRLGKESDNFTAEMLVKSLAAHVTSRRGTTEDGVQAIVRYAERIRPLSAGSRLINGSGLYDANRLSAALLTDVMLHARRDPRIGPEFWQALP